MPDQDAWKKAAAEAAAKKVESGMVLGLGTGGDFSFVHLCAQNTEI